MPKVSKTKSKSPHFKKKTVKKTTKRKAPTKSRKTFDSELKAIYKEGGKMPNLTKLEKKKTSPLTRFLIRFIVIAVFLAAIAWAGFLFFNPWAGNDGQSLEVTIEAPDEVRSGEEIEISIDYDNNGRVSLAALEIQLNLPESFTLTESNPEATGGDNVWTVGSLKPGADGSIELKGVILESIDTTSTVQAIITYRPGNFNADFQDIETKEFLIESSVLEAELAGPSKALPGDSLDYVYELTNTGEQTLNNFYVELSPSAAFLVEEVDPEYESEEHLRWKIDSLEPEEQIELTFKGNFSAETEGLQEVGVVSYFEDILGEQLIQTDSQSQIEVLGGNLIVHTIVNGSSSDQTVEIGETLRLSIDYSNDGDEPIGDIGFELTLSGAGGADVPIAWEDADLSGGSFDPVDNTVTWSMNNTPGLSTLENGDTGVIDVSLPIVDEFDSEILADEFSLSLESSLENIGGVASPRTLSSSPITIKVNSDLALAAESRYYDDEGTELGTGPLPPVVGSLTSYRIFWNVINSMHKLEDIEVSTTLPLDVAWTGRTTTDIGELSFDPESRTVRWYVSSLPTSISSVDCSFEVSITPDESDVGTFVRLTNETSVTADDTQTEESVSRTSEALTTDLTNDPIGSGQGIVLEGE